MQKKNWRKPVNKWTKRENGIRTQRERKLEPEALQYRPQRRDQVSTTRNAREIAISAVWHILFLRTKKVQYNPTTRTCMQIWHGVLKQLSPNLHADLLFSFLEGPIPVPICLYARDNGAFSTWKLTWRSCGSRLGLAQTKEEGRSGFLRRMVDLSTWVALFDCLKKKVALFVRSVNGWPIARWPFEFSEKWVWKFCKKT